VMSMDVRKGRSYCYQSILRIIKAKVVSQFETRILGQDREWQLKEISIDSLSFGMLSEERMDNVFSI